MGHLVIMTTDHLAREAPHRRLMKFQAQVSLVAKDLFVPNPTDGMVASPIIPFYPIFVQM